MKSETSKLITCYGRVVGPGWIQEHYETASRDAGMRVRQLRKAGFNCVSCRLGSQVTGVGLVKMTCVTVFGDDVPAPAQIERL